MQQLLACLTICLFSCSYRRHDVSGKWKVSAFSVFDSSTNAGWKFDVNDIPKSRVDLFHYSQLQYNERGGFEPSNTVVAVTVASLQDARFHFLDSGEAILESGAAVIPAIRPGLHLQTPLAGRWQLVNDTLILNFQNINGGRYAFVVLNKNDKELRLRFVSSSGYNPELKPEIVLIRQ